MDLRPDFSSVIQIVSFLILWFGLKRLLFDPVLHVLEVRESRTDGTRRDAAETRATADTAAAEYERRMQEARLSLAADSQAAHAAAQAEERRVVAEAREHAATQLQQLRQSLARQAAAARPGIGSEARELAGQIVERVVGRPAA